MQSKTSVIEITGCSLFVLCAAWFTHRSAALQRNSQWSTVGRFDSWCTRANLKHNIKITNSGGCEGPVHMCVLCKLPSSWLKTKESPFFIRFNLELYFSAAGSVSNAGFSTQDDLQTTRRASACARMKSSPWRTSVSKHTHAYSYIYYTHAHQLAGREKCSHLWHLQKFSFSHYIPLPLSLFIRLTVFLCWPA